MPTDGSRIATEAERRQHQKRLRKRWARLGIRTRDQAVRHIASRPDRDRLTSADLRTYLDVLPQLWHWDRDIVDTYLGLLDQVTPGGIDAPLSRPKIAAQLPAMCQAMIEFIGPQHLPPEYRVPPADARSAYRTLLLIRGFVG